MGFGAAEPGQPEKRPAHGAAIDPVQHHLIELCKSDHWVQVPPAFAHRDIPVTTTLTRRLGEDRGILGHTHGRDPLIIEPEQEPVPNQDTMNIMPLRTGVGVQAGPMVGRHPRIQFETIDDVEIDEIDPGLRVQFVTTGRLNR